MDKTAYAGMPRYGDSDDRMARGDARIISSCLGGSAAAVTRYLVGNADPITLAILRWELAFSACCR